MAGLHIPKLIHSSSSKYNENIEVYQVGESRRLSVNGTVQSVSRNCPSVRNRVWGRIVQTIEEQAPDAKHILMFGLGGATCLHLLANDMPETHVTVIEIDKAMIDIARQYFDLDDLKNTKIINEDALRVITEPEKYELFKGTFDVVVIDIYCGDDYPELGTSGTFFQGVKWFLRQGGLALFNRIYVTEHQGKVNEFQKNVEMHFQDVETVAVAGRTNSDNILIFGRV